MRAKAIWPNWRSTGGPNGLSRIDWLLGWLEEIAEATGQDGQ
jgi:hypothetical protein